MTTDFKSFAKELVMQAKDYIPADISNKESEHITDTIYNFIILSVESMKDDKVYTIEQKKIIAQYVAEWTFHKDIDLLRANICEELRNEILEGVAFVIYEIAKQAMEKDLEQHEITQVIEHHVNKKYSELIHKIYAVGEITKEQKENALKQSNIDTMRKSAEKSDDDDDFFDDDILQNENLDKEILKASKIELNMRKLAFKYLVKASHCLKKAKVGDKRRKFIVKQLAIYTGQIIEYINFEEFNIKEKDVYKLVAISMQIIFSRVVAISYSRIDKNLWKNVLYDMTENIYINVIYNLKRKLKLEDFHEWVRVWANEKYSNCLKEGFEYGAITKEHIKKAKQKCNIPYLEKDIDKMMAKIHFARIFVYSVTAIFILGELLKVFMHAIH